MGQFFLVFFLISYSVLLLFHNVVESFRAEGPLFPAGSHRSVENTMNFFGYEVLKFQVIIPRKQCENVLPSYFLWMNTLVIPVIILCFGHNQTLANNKQQSFHVTATYKTVIKLSSYRLMYENITIRRI